EWHFAVADNFSKSENVVLEAQLYREEGGAWTSISAPLTVPPVEGSGYNRALTISTDLSPLVGLISGHYKLRVLATDEAGNSTQLARDWRQPSLPPAVRQRAGGNCDACDPRCPNYYALGDWTACAGTPGANRADVILAQDGPPGQTVLGEGWIDNPNPLP